MTISESRRPKVLTLRVSDEEHHALATAATHRGVSVSSLVRSRALHEGKLVSNSRLDDGIYEALEEVDYYFNLYMQSQSVYDKARYFVALSNAMSDLRTWHPGYDADTHTLPWERRDVG